MHNEAIGATGGSSSDTRVLANWSTKYPSSDPKESWGGRASVEASPHGLLHL